MRPTLDLCPVAAILELAIRQQIDRGGDQRVERPARDGALVQLALRLRAEEGDRELDCLGHLVGVFRHDSGVEEVLLPVIPVDPLQVPGQLDPVLAHPLQGLVDGGELRPVDAHRDERVAVDRLDHVPQLEARHALRRGRGAVVAKAGLVAARVGREAVGVHRRPDHAGLHRDIEVLPEARSVSLDEGDDDIRRGLRSAVQPGLRVADRHGRPVAVAREREQPARRLDRQVRRRRVRVRAALPVGGDRGVDQRRVERAQVLVAKSEAGQAPRLERLQQDVRAFNERPQLCLALGGREVEHDAALAAAVRGPVERAVRIALAPVLEGGHAPGGAALGRLDLKHLRAEVREDPAGDLAARRRQVQDADAGERWGCGFWRHRWTVALPGLARSAR